MFIAMFKPVLALSLAASLTLAQTAAGQATRPADELIPRAALFGNPDRAAVRISPDGTKLGFVAPLDGVLNVFVGPVDDPDAAEPITRSTDRPITNWSFAYDGKHAIYAQDVGGDENNTIFAVDLETGEKRPLTPNAEVKDVADAVQTEGRVAGRIQATSSEKPGSILVGINDRDPRFHDVYEVDLATGERTLVAENPGMVGQDIFAGFATDDEYNVRYASVITNDGGAKMYAWNSDTKEIGDEVIDIPADDILTTSPQGFAPDNQKMFVVDSRERDKSAAYLWNPETGEKTLLAEDERADVLGVITHPKTREAQAAVSNYLKNDYQYLDDDFEAGMATLREEIGDGEIEITSRTLDDRTWLVAHVVSDGPVKYHLFDRDAGSVEYLFSNRSALEDLDLAQMHPTVIEARDGLGLVSYLTVPGAVETSMKSAEFEGTGFEYAVPSEPLPMVLYVHGGPWARDSYGYNPIHQWLADRGYAVLSVNYRGSTGFGKGFINASNMEWGGKMHDDLIDAVEWAVEEGIADPDKVAIMGGSYGGYATLVGVTFTPDQFAAGVSIVGPSNLVTLMQSIPPYWVAGKKLWQTRVGDVDTEEGREFLLSRSPISRVDQIRVPLLIGQGGNDPRVKQAESDQIVEAMQSKDIPVTYALYPDEGHGFARPENRLSFYGITEAFLAQHLGGSYSPLTVEDFEGSSVQVPAGTEGVPGLESVMK
jgi:dipeptidyl aminopeptidase/acylaminoacyl peptidase